MFSGFVGPRVPARWSRVLGEKPRLGRAGAKDEGGRAAEGGSCKQDSRHRDGLDYTQTHTHTHTHMLTVNWGE